MPDDEVVDQNLSENLNTGTPSGDTGSDFSPPAGDTDKQSDTTKRLSVRESIQDALRQANQKADADETTKTPELGAAKPGLKAGAKDSKTTPPQGTPQAPTTDAPEAWKSKDWKPLWDGLSPQVRAAITKREQDMANGVQQLKTRYQELDGAVAPYRETVKRFGFTDAQAVDQLFKWQMALAGPDKVRAFIALMQSHGVDPATVAAASTGQRGAAPQNGTVAAIPQELKSFMDGVNQKLGAFDQHVQGQMRSAAENTVMAWAKDKPHYDKVRQLMAQLIQGGAVPNLANGLPDLDTAYDMAIRSHPDVRDVVAAEERTKTDAARKATVDKAKKAGSSMRSGAPVPPAEGARQNGKDARNETVRDSIKRALVELRQ